MVAITTPHIPLICRNSCKTDTQGERETFLVTQEQSNSVVAKGRLVVFD